MLFEIKMSTRNFSDDIYDEITNFGNEYCNDNMFNLLGWRSVPIIEVNGAKNCN